jgi:chromosome condensin MukBEF ATPase and DNA-binding subunit MukB
MNVLTLRVKVTQAQKATTTAEAAHVMVVLVAVTFAQEAATTWDSVVTLVKDAEDWATLSERGAQERVSRGEVESAVALASACEDVEGLIWR